MGSLRRTGCLRVERQVLWLEGMFELARNREGLIEFDFVLSYIVYSECFNPWEKATLCKLAVLSFRCNLDPMVMASGIGYTAQTASTY